MHKAQRFDPRQKMNNKTFEVFLYREPKAADVEVHHHDFYEVYCFVAGEAEYWVEGRSYFLNPGDLLLISPMELHKPIVKSGSVYERIVLWIDSSYINSLSSDELLSRCFKRDGNLLHGGTAITERLYELVRESHSENYGSSVLATAIFLHLMVEINRLLPANAEDRSSLVTRVLSYIGERYSEAISLDSLASNFFVSKFHLSHEFKKETGTSVYRYITLKRLAAARQLLINGASPSEACNESGFKDYTAFYKAFKTEYGASPSNIK